MQYANMITGRFLARPNRFIAHVVIDGREEIVHVKNTGRCKELLIPGATVYLEKGMNPARKTPYDLIAVEKGTLFSNMILRRNSIWQRFLLAPESMFRVPVN